MVMRGSPFKSSIISRHITTRYDAPEPRYDFSRVMTVLDSSMYWSYEQLM